MLATIKKTKKKRCYLDVDVNDGGDLHQNHRSANHRHCKPVKPQRLPPTQSLLKTHQHLKLPSLLTALSLALVLLFVIRSPRNVTYSESGQWTRHKLFCRKSWTSARRSPPAPPVAPEPSQLPLPSLDREQTAIAIATPRNSNRPTANHYIGMHVGVCRQSAPTAQDVRARRSRQHIETCWGTL